MKIDQNIPQETKVNHNRPKSTATGQGEPQEAKKCHKRPKSTTSCHDEPQCTVWFTLVFWVASLAGVLVHFGH